MKVAIAVTAILLSGTMTWGFAEEETGDQGKLLFENIHLGTNGKSCATCHPGGRKLEWPATFPDDKLANLTNTCISNALKGKPLAVDSIELKALVRYIKTFAGP